MRVAQLLFVLAAGCSARGPVEAPEPNPEPESEAAADPAAQELDFSEEAAEPGNAVDAQPDRPPIGSFELCGDKCRDNVELKKSVPDE